MNTWPLLESAFSWRSTFPGPVGWGQRSLCLVADADSEPDHAPGDLLQSLHPTWPALSAGGDPHSRAEPQIRGVPGEGLQTAGPWDAGPRAESAAEMTVKVKSFYLFQERTGKWTWTYYMKTDKQKKGPNS